MLIKPFKFSRTQKYFSKDDLRILDVGAGSHSPTITKKWVPKSHYSGIDITKSYDNDEADLKAMDEFFQMDLTKLDFRNIPDNSYDLIVMSHVIEHLQNGDKVILGLLPKLKKDAIIYIEFPSERSVNFPSMRETLNFYDDKTHCRIYTVKEISDLLSQNQMQIISSGIKRQWINILVMPIKIVIQLLTKGYVRAGVFWDFYGFAEYVIAKK